MKKNIKKRVCDNCKKEVVEENIMFGGNVFNGWWELDLTNTSSMLYVGDPISWDACCEECAIELLTKRVNNELKKDDPPSWTKLMQDMAEKIHDTKKS